MLSTVIEVMSACTGEGATTMVAKVMNKQIGKNPQQIDTVLLSFFLSFIDSFNLMSKVLGIPNFTGLCIRTKIEGL